MPVRSWLFVKSSSQIRKSRAARSDGLPSTYGLPLSVQQLINMASNAAEISQAAAETVDEVADRLQDMSASTSGSNECELMRFASYINAGSSSKPPGAAAD